MKKAKNVFFVDAETDGLYGDFLSIAALVFDENGKEIDIFYKAAQDTCCKKNHLDWVKKNVLPYLENCDWVSSEEKLIDLFWKFWFKYKDNSLCIADVPYPVEFRLFQKCVEKNVVERSMDAPYPLLDISSMLYAKGLDPNIERKQLIKEEDGIVHNALLDARRSMSVWRRLCIDNNL